MRRWITLFGALSCSLTLWASDPGERLDCSDMVIHEPGYSCVMVVSDTDLLAGR
jgi:hypothetical protein